MALAPSSRDVRKAHWFFACGWLLTMGRAAQFVANMSTPPLLRYGSAFLIFGIVGMFWVGSHDWVQKKHKSLQAPRSQPLTNPNELLERYRGQPIPSEVQPLTGGSDLKRPFLVPHIEQLTWGTVDREPNKGATALSIQVTLINRGEASVARNFKLRFTDENGVVFIQEAQPMNPKMVMRDASNLTGIPAESLAEKASHPIEHGIPCIGWLLFYTTPKLAEKIIAGQIKPLTLEYTDYLDHRYTTDFSSQLAPVQRQRYVPGANQH
jgi:hypothetical protein